MQSLIERSSSSRNSTPLVPGGIVIAYDAMKIPDFEVFKGIITNVLKREEAIQEVKTITLLGVLDKVLHPMGFQIQIGQKSFIRAHARAIKEEVSRKVDACARNLKYSAVECEGKGIEIKVKIAVGAPMKNVLVEQIVALQASWAILDRQLRKELRFYLRHIPCKIAHVRDNLSLEVLRSYYRDMVIDTTEHKVLYTLSKPVPLLPSQDDQSDVDSVISAPVSDLISYDIPNSSPVLGLYSALYTKEQSGLVDDESASNPQREVSGSQNEERDGFVHVIEEERDQHNDSGEVAVLYTADTTKARQDALWPSYSEIQVEPGEYSSDTSPEEGTGAKVENKHDGSPKEKQEQIYLDTPILGSADKTDMDFNSLGYSYSSIQIATDNFSCENFLGEGGYGVVYKGKSDDGQLIAVKVQTDINTQSFAEFHSLLSALSFARHTNIVTLLGYCCKENLKILIYEYIGNQSLEWHLFDNVEKVLEWNQRRDIAIGTARGLKFLHEECRGGPIIHRDIRPSNIFLTHEFVPLLGDSGLAKWKTCKFDKQRGILCNLAYLAPEYAENGVCSEKTDIYAFGVLLIQLISGRKVVDSTEENYQQSIRQWALALIESHALHDLIDPRIGDTYSEYDLYNMARAAYLCVQNKPIWRPTMGEVLCLLEGTNDHLRHVKSSLYPMIITTDS